MPLFLLTACAWAAEPVPLPLRLATLRRATSGTTAPVPTAIVGQIRRPVLAPWRRTLVARSVVAAAPPRRVDVTVSFGERMRGTPVRLDALLTYFKVAVPERARGIVQTMGRVLGAAADLHVPVMPGMVDRPGATTQVAVDLPPATAPGDALVEVYARPIEAAWTSPPLTVPAHAVLRFGIGIGPDDAAIDLAAARAEVSVLDGDATRVVFSHALAGAGFDRSRWNDEEVDLSPFAGRTVRLRFATTDRSGTPPLLWSDPTILVPRARASERPNLVLISLDTLRADHLGSYGYPRPTSPTIDGWLAARGTVFEHASTAFPNTAGSHMTMLTAVDPCVHGLDTTTFGGATRVRDDVVTLAEVLRDAGYDTAAFTEDAWVTASVGYDRGFGTFVEDSGRATNSGNVETTLRRGTEWMAAHRRDPFFLFLHTYQVHEPYEPPPGYAEEVAHGHGTTRPEKEMALYDGEIRYTDDVLARFLAALDADGLAGRTLVLVVADHGQHFGEHGVYGHSTTLFEQLLHVPMILRGPGVPAGLRVPDQVGLIDIVPTVLELMGVAPPRDIQGWSLVPTLHGKKLPPRTLYAELPERGLFAARRGTLKLLFNTKTGHDAAFDLASDPGELHDVAASQPAALWQEVARDHLEHCRRGAQPPSPSEAAPAIGGDVRRKLESLGYTE